MPYFVGVNLVAAAAHHTTGLHAAWNQFWHQVGHYVGANNEGGWEYGFLSAGAVLAGLVTIYWHHTCHRPYRWFGSCWRLTHQTVTNDAGVDYRVCHHHHRHHTGRFTAEHFDQAIDEHVARHRHKDTP
jgi:hypothetical protein